MGGGGGVDGGGGACWDWLIFGFPLFRFLLCGAAGFNEGSGGLLLYIALCIVNSSSNVATSERNSLSQNKKIMRMFAGNYIKSEKKKVIENVFIHEKFLYGLF